MLIALNIFLFVIFFTFFVFIIYPFLFIVLAVLFEKKTEQKDSDYFPFISIIVCAKDEENHIEKKIKNLLDLDYPSNNFEFVIVSDGSTDKTNDIIKKYEKKIRPIYLKKNVGKTEAQNIAVKKSKGEILFFSDANSVINKNALKTIVHHFKDKKVAGVSGCLLYTKNNSDRNMESEYNNLDIKIKKAESKLKSVFGSFGTLYAIRKSCYEPLPPYIISDFVEPSLLLINGYANIFEPKALSFETVNESLHNEMKRKSRIILRSLIGYFYLIKNGLITKPFLFIHSLFRKFFRWLLPFYFIAGITCFGIFLFFLNILLFLIYCICILLFFFISVYLFFKKTKQNKLFKILSYVFILFGATFIAFFKFIKGDKIISWTPRE